MHRLPPELRARTAARIGGFGLPAAVCGQRGPDATGPVHLAGSGRARSAGGQGGQGARRRDRVPGGGPWPACCPTGTGCSCAAPTAVGPGGGQRLADRITAIAGRAAVYEQLCGGRPAVAVRAAPRPVAGADVGPGHRRGTGFAGPRPGEVTRGAWLLNGGKSTVGDEDPRAPTAEASCTAMADDPASPAGQRGPSAGRAAGRSPGPLPPPPPAGNGPAP